MGLEGFGAAVCGTRKGKGYSRKAEGDAGIHLLGKSEPLCRAGESWEGSRNLLGEVERELKSVSIGTR